MSIKKTSVAAICAIGLAAAFASGTAAPDESRVLVCG